MSNPWWIIGLFSISVLFSEGCIKTELYISSRLSALPFKSIQVVGCIAEDVSLFAYPFTYGTTIWLFLPPACYYRQSCYENYCTGFCVDTVFISMGSAEKFDC
jgi:hypothetical protein